MSVELKVPSLGESITEAIVGRWLKNVGDHVEVDEPVLDLETDKITVQLPAPKAGALLAQKAAEGDTVRVGDVVGEIDENATGTVSAPASKAAVPAAPTQAAPAAPVAVDTAGRGNDGRLLSPSERRQRMSGVPAPVGTVETKPIARPSLPSVRPANLEEVVPMSPLRKRIAERLVEAQHSTASLTTFNEVDMSAVMDLRKRFKEPFLASHGIKLGFMSFFVKASVAALKLFPGLNAEVRDDSIVYKHHYDVGIAVGTKKGLVVPVLRHADRLSYAGIEQGILDLAGKARDSKLTLDDLTGATFTITNGGIYGSMMSTPLLNYPQTGILGMHNIVERPMVVDGRVEVRPMMYLALTYDHRVVDGKEAVQFLVAVKERIEDPERLTFEV
jgi:2-oxoglutarate dehydrogenase E2 component (dihydrolipoamide succinyltransferase)